MKKGSTQILIAGFILLTSALFLNQKVIAQTTTDPFVVHSETVEQKKLEFEEEVGSGSPSLPNLTHNTVIYSNLSLLTMIAGESLLEEESTSNSGAIPALTGLIATMYENKPASTHTFLADLSQSARIIPTAHAQGLGFASLNPILYIWKSFRNIAYFIFVLVFLITGFMIMFRHKIKGQTVVTVEQAIPNIVVALLFVTFSYAIGGLMIDFMYLIMHLIIGLFEQSRDIINLNIFQLGVRLVRTGVVDGYEVTNEAIQSIVRVAGLGELFSWMGSLTVAVIIGLAILFGVFRLFWELLKSYLSIIISIAFSPLILMIGAIPGQNTFQKWFKNLAANLVVFPVVLILFIMQMAIQHGSIGTVGSGFMPPFLIGHGAASVMPQVVGIGILLAIPEIIKKAKEQMGASEGIFGELSGAALGRFKKGVPAGATLAGAQVGATVGGLVGLGKGTVAAAKAEKGTSARDRFKMLGSETLKGAGAGVAVGGFSPIGLPMAYRAVKGGVSKAKDDVIREQAGLAYDRITKKRQADEDGTETTEVIDANKVPD